MEIIRCTKCQCEIPKKSKKKYKFLFWNYNNYDQQYYSWDKDKGNAIHLCMDCYKDFRKWLRKSN